MNSLRQQNFNQRKEKILAQAEILLLENNEDITLNDLASEIDVAKGTIYKHFSSKNQLYLELIILNEQRILALCQKSELDFKSYVKEYMLYHLLNAQRTIMFHMIEERLTNTERNLKEHFQKLYQIREERILLLKDLTQDYLKSIHSTLSIRDYLSYIWTITHGAALLLNSTSYQKAIGCRERMIQLYIDQALFLSPQQKTA
ncbi:TetR family transcriptional regulator [Acinetobacter sp. NCu2D-2]|uniref:TetR/AcrR family transcriptional regulator n=1 Tax=Acinetobacter sp. NCu2D-2 TaxID=1608473 RepID=UPI0007CDF361|nr:TetR/AcrR family transcriptional regulator [Acinetobacter sp. NCu2D-2]ANF81791.1 TetR family transcriptional regulator [Acinetobacter sp. NCu2D-2]